MDYSIWYADLDKYWPEGEKFELDETLSVLKERRVGKKVPLPTCRSKDIVFQDVEASIISFPTTLMMESGPLDTVDVFSGKSDTLDLNIRSIIKYI